MVKIFFSHSTKDNRLVIGLKKKLEDNYNIEVYLAERDYQLGKSLPQKIMENIDSSKYFLIIYTFNGNSSRYVQQEIGYWFGKNGYRNLIPFVERGIQPEGFLQSAEYIEFNRHNLNIGIENIFNYLNQRIAERNQQIRTIGLGIGLVGIASLVIYGLSKLNKEDNTNI
ncbi:MAG: toll/interleukin-1 receptor domain-containing protein [Promethearchaeota archaeon]